MFNLTDNIAKLHFVAQFLLKNESMDEEQFKSAMEMEDPTIEYIESIALDKKKKSEAENQTAHENNARAEEEAREKARIEEELRKKQEEKSDGFLEDDFFNNIFSVPEEENEPSEASEDQKSQDVDGISDNASESTGSEEDSDDSSDK